MAVTKGTTPGLDADAETLELTTVSKSDCASTDMTAEIADAQTAHDEIKLILAAAETRAATDRTARVTAACTGWSDETAQNTTVLSRQAVPQLDLLAGYLKNAADRMALVKAGGGSGAQFNKYT